MTSEEFVKTIYPNSFCEVRKLNRDGYRRTYSYYCIMNNDEIIAKSHGNATSAWVIARKTILKGKGINESITVQEIAKLEWDKMYPQGDLITMSERERDFSWQHWLRAWQLAENRFK